MSDDPFDQDNDGRTVIRPNPGGRRPAPPREAGPSSLGAPQGGFGPSGYGQQAGYGQAGPGPARPQSPVPRDNWGVVQPQTPAGYDDLRRPPLIKREEMIVPHQNPIMRAAGPMLLLLGRLRIALMRASLGELMESVADSISAFELEVRAAGVPDAPANAAKYVLCATADDIVQNIPAEDKHLWAQYSMESRFFRSRIGGEDFFKVLNSALADPVHSAALLELQHACLALGFQGVHRTLAGGQASLQNLQRQAYESLTRVAPRRPEEISPRWRGMELRSRQGRIRVPFWVSLVLVLAGLGALYLTYLELLGSRAEAVAGDLTGLHKPIQLSLYRTQPAPPPPPPKEPDPPPPPPPGAAPVPLTQLQRIRQALAPEISAGAIAVDAVGTHIIVRVGSALLFDSGKADVKAEFKALAIRLEQMLEKEAGPILVIGHTDTTPIRTARFKSNYDLSVERAKNTADILKTGLTAPDRLKTEGRGEQEPVQPNDTEPHKAKNRRVELWIDRVDGST